MPAQDSELDSYLTACRDRLGDPSRWADRAAYHHSLALCVIDAVQSTAACVDRTVQVVDRYRAYRRAQGEDGDRDGTRALLRTFEDVGGCLPWEGKIGSYKCHFSDSDVPLEAMAIEGAAEALYRLHINDVDDLLVAATEPSRLAQIRSAWLAVSERTDEISWLYLLTLAGVPGHDWPRATAGFTAAALGLDDVPTELVGDLRADAAAQLNLEPEDLDRAIWRWAVASSSPHVAGDQDSAAIALPDTALREAELQEAARAALRDDADSPRRAARLRVVA